MFGTDANIFVIDLPVTSSRETVTFFEAGYRLAKTKTKLTPLGANLKTLMRLHRTNVSQLAKIGEVGATTLSNWVAGRTPANFAALKRIADAYHSTLDELLLGTITATPKPPQHSILARQDARLTFEGQTYVSLQLIIPANFQPLETHIAVEKDKA